MTKLELQQRLQAALQENVALRTELSVLRAEVERLRTQQPRTQPKVANTELRSRMAAARELAMRTGRVVRVELA